MTIRKCIDCGTIDTSNPYRILCPKGQGLRSRNGECSLQLDDAYTTLEHVHRLEERIDRESLTIETYKCVKKALEAWKAVLEELEAKKK